MEVCDVHYKAEVRVHNANSFGPQSRPFVLVPRLSATGDNSTFDELWNNQLCANSDCCFGDSPHCLRRKRVTVTSTSRREACNEHQWRCRGRCTSRPSPVTRNSVEWWRLWISTGRSGKWERSIDDATALDAHTMRPNEAPRHRTQHSDDDDGTGLTQLWHPKAPKALSHQKLCFKINLGSLKKCRFRCGFQNLAPFFITIITKDLKREKRKTEKHSAGKSQENFCIFVS
ncbi:hypothetical protein TcasGA2_TC001095 [Tribolium castaneum]|uniref:Uncharacterized protein n=1 Tax=Tribolium castaneum TaxID=7070 RepID=D6WA36_TRICA|nr:hypothetical protein TcasGA2_TC001095 [Tribolium castaneum]